MVGFTKLKIGIPLAEWIKKKKHTSTVFIYKGLTLNPKAQNRLVMKEWKKISDVKSTKKRTGIATLFVL